MKSPLVSIIVATYNRWDLLQRWLQSIKKQSFTNVEIVVVDNGSDAETELGMKSRTHVRYIKPGRNTGFAGGNNLGAKEATGQYLFLLNNDAFLGKDTLRDIVDYAEAHPDVAVMQPTILIGDGDYSDHSDEIRNFGSQLSNGAGSFLTKWGFLWHRGYQDPLSKLSQEPDAIFTALGAGMLIRSDVVKKHGLFDESFFAYFEETDFCWRLWTRGEQVAYVPTDPMWHMGGQTAKVFKEKAVIFYSYRNRLIALWRHLELPNLVNLLLRHHLAILGVMLALIPRRPAASGWLLLVFGWELLHLLPLFATRAEHMKQRTVSDPAIWPKIYRQRSLQQMMAYLRG